MQSAAIPPPFEWRGRNRRPPRDPVNALLSLTYMMALSEVVTSCYAHGLDPFVGFLHQLDYSRPSLALDLLEPLRAPMCAHFVLRLFQEEIFVPEDFSLSDTNGCRLSSSALQIYLERFNRVRESGFNRGPGLARGAENLVLAMAEAIRTRSALVVP